MHRTVYVHLFAREYAGRSFHGRYVLDALVLSLIKLLSPRAARLRRRAALHCTVEQARHLGVHEQRVLAEYSPRRLIEEVAVRHGISARLLLAAPRMQPGVPWDTALLREARSSGEFEPMVECAARVQAFAGATAEQVPGLLESLSLERLERWAAARWGIDKTALGRHLVQRGFSSYREFVDVARLAYAHEWLGTDPHALRQAQNERVPSGVRA